jgi:tagatose 1,6-diphosphate aldolase
MDFRFLDPGPLIDRELQLVAPDARLIDDVLAACAHPLSRTDAQASAVSREKLLDFLRAAPGGRQRGDERGIVPAYHFWMKLSRAPQGATPHAPGAATPHGHDASDTRALPTWGAGEPPVRVAGWLGLRIGSTRDLEMYFGHIGYNVFPPARGNHYAERACRLLLPLARGHGMRTMWITCNPDNAASRRTCERLGCTLVDTVPVPVTHTLYLRGERQKCRYRLDL